MRSPRFAQFTDITPEEYKQVTEVSYLGYEYGTMAALKRMLPRDAGTIVQVGSALAYRGIPLQTAYCGAKHAIQGCHEALRCELLHKKSNVHVTMTQMPAVNTPQFDWVLSCLPKPAQPVPPIYQPELAARILYAADHPRRCEYWIVGGSTTCGSQPMVLTATTTPPAAASMPGPRTAASSYGHHSIMGCWPRPPDYPPPRCWRRGRHAGEHAARRALAGSATNCGRYSRFARITMGSVAQPR